MSVLADDTGAQSPENEGAVYNEFKDPQYARLQDDLFTVAKDSQATDQQDFFEFDFSEVPDFAVIDGILIEMDAYGVGGSPNNFDVNISWDNGVSYTSNNNTGLLPGSDTDTYIPLGSSTDTWGRTWNYTELRAGTFQVAVNYNGCITCQGRIDHIRVTIFYTWVRPDEPTEFFTYNRLNYCNQSVFSWIKGINSDKTLIRLSEEGFPTPTGGTFVYNGSGNSCNIDYNSLGMISNNEYYISIWAWNETYHSLSSQYNKVFVSPCNCTIGTVENIVNATGTHEGSYSKSSGWTVWANYTGNETECPAPPVFSDAKTYILFNRSVIEGDNVNVSFDIFDADAVFNYTIEFGLQSKSGLNAVNGTYFLLCENVSAFHNNTVWVNVSKSSDLVNAKFSSVLVTSDLSISFDVDQFALFIGLLLMCFFFVVGYFSDKNSGGLFIVLSGFLLFGNEVLLVGYLSAFYVLPLLSPIGLFMVFIGFYKFLYRMNDKDDV